MSILSRLLGPRRGNPVRAPRQAPPPRASDDPTALLPFMIRPLEAGDAQHLAAIFEQAVTILADGDYDRQQRRAWSGLANDPAFEAQLTRGTTVVAVAFGEPVGFAQLAPNDYITMIYVHPDHAGQGVATLLCQYLEDEARIAGATRLRTHASKTAHRFFKTLGFQGDRAESVKRQRRKLTRYPMEKSL